MPKPATEAPAPATMPPPTGEVTVVAGASIQAAIDSAPHGTLIRLGAGVHRPNTVLDLSPKNALRIEGLGGVGYNEDEAWGTVITPNFRGPVFRDTGVGVKHAATKYAWLNLRPNLAGSGGWLLRAVNHVLIRDCSAKGPFATVIDGDIPMSQYPKGDHAYNKAENLTVVNTQPNARGFVLGDGFWWLVDCNFDLTGLEPVAITNLRGNLSIRGGKANNAGTLLYSSGSYCDVLGMKFEQAPYTGAYMVVVERGSSPVWAAGCYHSFLGCTFMGHEDSEATGARIASFGPETYGNRLPATLNTMAYLRPLSLVNRGADGQDVFTGG